MNNELIVSMINNLPEDLKKKVLDFIESLMTKYPYRIKKQNNIPTFGSGKGLFIIPDDFDAPLKDFEEYM